MRQILQWQRLILVRRMVGVAAFAYVLIHFSLYIADQAFDLGKVASEIVLRIYLTIGFAALFGLASLGGDLDRRRWCAGSAGAGSAAPAGLRDRAARPSSTTSCSRSSICGSRRSFPASMAG